MKFTDVLIDITEDLEKFEKEFIEALKTNIQDKTPVATGALKNSLEVDRDTITSDSDYLHAVEFGTKFNPPVAMVRRTVLESQQIADKLARKVGRMK